MPFYLTVNFRLKGDESGYKCDWVFQNTKETMVDNESHYVLEKWCGICKAGCRIYRKKSSIAVRANLFVRHSSPSA